MRALLKRHLQTEHMETLNGGTENNSLIREGLQDHTVGLSS